LDDCWIQKSIVWNVASKNFKRTRDQLSHINCSYTFLSTTCNTTKDVDLGWNDFEKNYKLLYFTITIHEHVIVKFLDLLHCLDYWVVYKEEKGIHLVRPKRTPPNCWRLGPRREIIMNLMILHRRQSRMLNLRVANPTTNKENLPLVFDP
jgi:hypothetical protein